LRHAKREVGFQQSKLKQFIIHPEFDQINVYADLALLEMTSPFTFSSYVKVKMDTQIRSVYILNIFNLSLPVLCPKISNFKVNTVGAW